MKIQAVPFTALLVAGLLAGRSSPALAGSSGTWAQTGSMSMARAGHTATLLNDGRVLVAGGVGSSGGNLASAEIYDPTTGTWTRTADMSQGRAYHTATLLSGGEVLVAGGRGSGGSSAELYDPVAGRWSATGSMAAARSHHAAALLAGGEVLVAGGVGSTGADLAGAEIYDPRTSAWAATGSMNVARAFAMATSLANGEVLIAGGNETTSAAGHSAEIFANGQWRLTGSMAWERGSDTSALLANGGVLVFGGGSLAGGEIYELAGGAWATTYGFGAAPPVAGQTETTLGTGEVMVVGGVDRYQGTDRIAHLYNPSTNRWLTSGAMNQARTQHAATVLWNGQVLVTGGELQVDSSGRITSTVFASAEIYSP